MEIKNKEISPTKPMDRLLARLRFVKTKPFIPKGARLLDIGAAEGTFFKVPRVDKILDALKFFRIIKGLSLEEHYGFDPECLPEIFNRWTLLKKERWEPGCNYLFIFGKS